MAMPSYTCTSMTCTELCLLERSVSSGRASGAKGASRHCYVIGAMAEPTDASQQRQLLEEAVAELHAQEEARADARPKNVGQGLGALVGDSLTGVALGAAAAVMAPVAGFRESGARGALGGALGGLVIGAGSATMGIASGISKFVDGTAATVRSGRSHENGVYAVAEGIMPDEQLYHREREALYGDLESEHAASATAAGSDTLQPPLDRGLYDVLGVEPSATDTQIRKAYYRLAQQFHPDKHPNDEHATTKFQSISEAYQCVVYLLTSHVLSCISCRSVLTELSFLPWHVFLMCARHRVLSDPVKREEYHRMGTASSEGLMDPKALFALMFSNFEHIVGDLATSTIMSTMRVDEGDSAPEIQEAARKKREQFQANREEHLAAMLLRRLEPWLAGDAEAFAEHARREVTVLRAEPFGRDMLKTVGYVYRKKAEILLGKTKGALGGVESFFGELRETASYWRSKVRALEGGMRIMSTASGAEGESIDEAARREAVSMLGVVYLSAVVDVQTTLRQVVKRVLTINEQSPRAIVKQRAEGLIVLGSIFESA